MEIVAEDRAVAGGLRLDPAERDRWRPRVPSRAQIARSEAAPAPAPQFRHRRQDPTHYLAHLSSFESDERNDGFFLIPTDSFCLSFFHSFFFLVEFFNRRAFLRDGGLLLFGFSYYQFSLWSLYFLLLLQNWHFLCSFILLVFLPCSALPNCGKELTPVFPVLLDVNS